MPALAAAQLRQILCAAYGLALEGLSDEQVVTAGAGVGARPPGLAAPLAEVVDRLPIDESWLFRDEPLWSWLRAELLPEQVGAALGAGRPYRALSLGCAGGQEAVSLALLVQERLAEAGLPASGAPGAARIVGLDASPARVAQASSGLVSGWSVQRSRAEWLRGKVRPVEPAGGRWRVDDDVRALCRFEVANLLDVAAPGSLALRGAQLVLCRHVLISFTPRQAAEVVAGLAAALDPGAVLVLSPVEAHFAEGLPGLSPLGPVGAWRAWAAPAARPTLPGVSLARLRLAPQARPRAPQAPPPAATGPSAAPAAPVADRISIRPSEAAARLASSAVAHAAAGRRADALREARAACFHDSSHLFSRLVLGRELLSVDPPRGQAVLAQLLDLARRLPADDEVPQAPGLSVGQLAAAARLLMSRGGER